MSIWLKPDYVAILILAMFAVGAGIGAMGFALCSNQLGALVALALSLFSGALWAGMIALKSSTRRLEMTTRNRVVEQALKYLLDEARRTSEQENVAGGAALVDRIHVLALKALENPARKP